MGNELSSIRSANKITKERHVLKRLDDIFRVMFGIIHMKFGINT